MRLHITQNGWWTIIVNHHPVNVILARVDKTDRKEWSYNDALKAVGVFAKQLRAISVLLCSVSYDINLSRKGE